MDTILPTNRIYLKMSQIRERGWEKGTRYEEVEQGE